MRTINERLDDYIFNNLGAIYSPDNIKAGDNLENTEEENKKYLGTYFPRSFCEAYNIYSNIFSQENIYNEFNNKDTIKILDIGSGTGGNLLGLLQVLLKKFEGKEIIIFSVDGNKNALEYQRRIFKDSKIFFDYSNNVKLNTKVIEFNDEVSLDSIVLATGESEFNIIHSFKFINELYRRNYYKYNGMYTNILNLAETTLNSNGLLVIVDITDKINDVYNSRYINRECRAFYKNGEKTLKYILPKCCCINYKKCFRDGCYSCLEFQVNHSKKSYDKTKIAYKLFIKNPLGSVIENYILQDGCGIWNNQCYCEDSTCRDNCSASKRQPYFL